MPALGLTLDEVTIVAANADVRRIQVGEAVEQGRPGRISSKKYYLCNSGTAVEAAASCLFLLPQDTDGYTYALFKGTYIVGATITLTTPYVVGPSDGDIIDYAGLASGQYVTYLGFAISTTTMYFRPYATGAAKP